MSNQGKIMTPAEQIVILEEAIRLAQDTMKTVSDVVEQRKWANTLATLNRELNDAIRLARELGKVTERRTITDLTPQGTT